MAQCKRLVHRPSLPPGVRALKTGLWTALTFSDRLPPASRRADRTWKAIRRDNLNNIWRQDGDPLEEYLFDLSKDPSEAGNLIEMLADSTQRLKRKLANWDQRM